MTRCQSQDRPFSLIESGREGSRRLSWARTPGSARSDALRAWFGHRPERWDEFRRHYRAELTRPEQQQLVEQLVELARKGPLTLLYGARDTERNQAVVIRELIEEQLHS